MKRKIYTAVIVVAIAGASTSALAGAGRSGCPPTSSYRDWLPATQVTAPAAVRYASPFESLHAPPLNNRSGMVQEPGLAPVSPTDLSRGDDPRS